MDIRTVEFHRAAYQPGEFPRDGRPQFAMVGRSNVGKSSLINAVLNRKGIARVSQTPGKTQAIQFYLVNEKFHLVDLPGYGYAKAPKSVVSQWGHLIRSYLEEAADLRVVFLLLDARRTPGDHDMQMYDWTRSIPRLDLIPVLTKTDKLSTNELNAATRRIATELQVDPDDLIATSTTHRKGIDQVRREMIARL